MRRSVDVQTRRGRTRCRTDPVRRAGRARGVSELRARAEVFPCCLRLSRGRSPKGRRKSCGGGLSCSFFVRIWRVSLLEHILGNEFPQYDGFAKKGIFSCRVADARASSNSFLFHVLLPRRQMATDKAAHMPETSLKPAGIVMCIFSCSLRGPASAWSVLVATSMSVIRQSKL